MSTAACPSNESFQEAVKKLGGILKPGGILLLIGSLKEDQYLAGDHAAFKNLTQNWSDVEEALTCEELKLGTWHKYPLSLADDLLVHKLTSGREHYVVSARKATEM